MYCVCPKAGTGIFVICIWLTSQSMRCASLDSGCFVIAWQIVTMLQVSLERFLVTG